MKVRVVLLTICFIGAIAITFLGLFYNIKTVVLNEELKTMKKELWRLKKENTKFSLSVMAETQLPIIEEKARLELGMIPEKEGKVIRVLLEDRVE